jgi:hypothetical protein
MNGRFELWVALAACAIVCLGPRGGAAGATANAAVAQPGDIANFIAIGTPDPKGNVPALDAVRDAGVDDVAMASPLGILQRNRIYALILNAQDSMFRRNCASSYALKQRAIVLASCDIHSYGCRPRTDWQWSKNTPAMGQQARSRDPGGHGNVWKPRPSLQRS